MFSQCDWQNITSVSKCHFRDVMVPSYSTGCLIKMTAWRSLNGCLIQMMAISMREQRAMATIIPGQSQRERWMRMHLFQALTGYGRQCKSLFLSVLHHKECYRQCFHAANAADVQRGRQRLPQRPPDWKWFCIWLASVVPDSQRQWDQWGFPIRPGRQSPASREPPRTCSVFCSTNKHKPQSQLPQ